MRRRNVLKTVASSGILGVTVGTAAGRSTTNTGGIRPEDLPKLHVARDGEIVATLSNPSTPQVKRLFAEMGDDEGLVTPENCCYYECKSDCYYCDYPPGCTDDCCCGWMDDGC